MTADRTTTELHEQLLAARAAGDYCPPWLVGSLDLDQALDLQLAVLDEKVGQGAAVGGWKVGLTSEASRTRLGADERPFGFVLGERTFTSGASIDSATVNSLSVETEMCFTVGTTVDQPDIGPDAILGYMSEVSAGFELNEARPGAARPDFFAMVTDCLTNWGIVCGRGISPLSAAELSATTITMERNGHNVFSGISSDFVDDHAISLCCLVEQLAKHGRQLEAGQKIITGAFARFAAAPGDHWRATYGNIGSVDIDVV